MVHRQKIVLWDVETSLALMATFGLKVDYIPHTNIIEDWYIICGRWKEYGKKKVHGVSLLDDPKRFAKNHKDDYHVVKALRDMVADADILVHHNGDRFDIKKLNARIIYHGLEPLPPIVTVDTLKEAKRIAAFTSHRLDYLSKHLGSKGKRPTSEGLWLRVLLGDRKAIEEMYRYNGDDVKELEFVYHRLRPYMKAHPQTVVSTTYRCECGSSMVQSRGIYTNRSGVIYNRFQCQSCRRWSRSRLKSREFISPPLVSV
jgi:hypothetical protein